MIENMIENMTENMIEMKTITNEEKLDLLFKNKNPLLEKAITNEYEQRLYDYYRLAEELLLLIKKRILLITNYSKLENTIDKIVLVEFYSEDLFPFIKQQIICVYKKMKEHKEVIFKDWDVYNKILNNLILQSEY
jgi:hypothetical protein